MKFYCSKKDKNVEVDSQDRCLEPRSRECEGCDRQ